jgi:cytochrome P450
MPNGFYEAMKAQIGWLIFDNQPQNLLSRNWNPIRPLAVWNNNRIMKAYLTPLIQEMLLGSKEKGGPKTILSLAIGAYKQGADKAKILDSTFMHILTANLKVFMLAGHDTTASILSYVYYVLSTNTVVRDAVRREHDAIFGPDPTAVTAKITATPTLLNQLPYTVAVIKETLRMFPPFGTIRAGGADFFLTHPDTGERYPTEGMMIFGCSIASQRLKEYWPEPDRCIPERWLVPEGDPLHPRKNAFRPFELGPRNCIGQELAMLELRMILAMTVRDFDIDTEYAADSPRALGEFAFQTMQMGQVSAYPKDGMPVRVRIRNGGAEDHCKSLS